MKIRFSLFIILSSQFFLSSCSENKKVTYVPVPGYPAPRSIKQVEAEDSWKKRADDMMLAKLTPLPVKHVSKITKLANHGFKKTVRKLTSNRKIKSKLLALNSKGKSEKRVLPIW